LSIGPFDWVTPLKSVAKRDRMAGGCARAASSDSEPNALRCQSMPSLKGNNTFALLAMLALAGCSGGAKLEGQRPPGPDYVGNVTVREPGAPDSAFTFRAAPGQLLFVFFGYANCPDICPMTLAELRRALRAIPAADARRVRVAFVTVDPYRDSASVLVPYLRTFADSAHALVPRSPAELARAESAFGATSTAARNDSGGVDVSHTGLAYVVDDRGRIRVEWDFGVKAKTMAHDLRLLLAPRAAA